MRLRKLEFEFKGNLRYFRSRASAFTLNVFKVYILKMSLNRKLTKIGLVSAQTSQQTSDEFHRKSGRSVLAYHELHYNFAFLCLLHSTSTLLLPMMIHDGMSRMINLDFLLVDGNLVRIAENSSNFLEWEPTCVWKDKQEYKTTDERQYDEDKIVLPSDVSAIALA